FFGDLYRVECRAFEQLIAAHPETQAVVHRAILAHSSHGAVVTFSNIERQWIPLVRGIVDDIESRRVLQNFTSRFDGNGFLKLCRDRDRVRAINGHAHASYARAKTRMVHDLSPFV